MSQKIKVGTYLDGFVMGEDGSWKLAPRPRKLSPHEIRPNTPNIRTRSRPHIHIEPMKLPSVDTPPEKKRPKVAKRVTAVRLPEPLESKKDNKKVNISKRLSFGTPASPSTTRKSKIDQSTKSKLTSINERPSKSNNLLDANRLPLKPMPPMTLKNNESDLEFLCLENELENLTDDNKVESPKIDKTCCKENTAILKEIRNLLERDHESLNDINQRVLRYYEEHQIMYNKIGDLLSQIDKKEDKENIVVSATVDLRRTTLNKNLLKNLGTEVKSPRMKKAVDLYNTMRTDYGVLCTPQIDRSAMDVRQASVTKSLSRRIQKQCLLLQDTPK